MNKKIKRGIVFIFFLILLFVYFTLKNYTFQRNHELYIFGEIEKCNENRVELLGKKENKFLELPFLDDQKKIIVINFSETMAFFTISDNMTEKSLIQQEKPSCKGRMVTAINPKKHGKTYVAKLVIFSDNKESPALMKHYK